MQILDTLPNLMFLQEYNEKQIKQQARKETKSGQKSRVVILAEACHGIISESQHRLKDAEHKLESRHQNKATTLKTLIPESRL